MNTDEYLLRISWNEVCSYLDEIATKLDPHDYSGVYGLPRGGLVLAAWLSHKLYIPMLHTPDRSCIIIDDICDSGDGMKKCLEEYGLAENNNCFITTMFLNKDSTFQNLDYFHRFKGENWIVFPWEK